MYRYCWLLSSLLCLPFLAHAADGFKSIPISNGVTKITLGGRPALAISAWRTMPNPHGFDLVSFYTREGDSAKDRLDLIPIISKDAKGGDDEKPSISVLGSADCIYQDFRLLRSTDGKKETLVVARNETGDKQTIHFRWYDLTSEENLETGVSDLSFKQVRETTSSKTYCDVNVAFDRELHLPGGAKRLDPMDQ